jgi:H+-translocating NAD(P) transhydrogenase subunit alpha
MRIGIPKEIMPGEKRVAAIPETVAKYIQLGFKVMAEKGAGAEAFYSDSAYMEAGATIAPNGRAVYENSDIVLKVKEPMPFGRGLHEVDLMREGAVLVAFLHPAAPSNYDTVKKLAKRNITAFTMDGIPRISRAQRMDALTSMSTLAGYKAVLLAASHMPVVLPMLGTAIGTLKPAHFLVIGAGVVGLQAIACAKRLGATVSAVDTRESARIAAKSLGAKVIGFEVPGEMAEAANGYALPLPEEWLKKEQEMILACINGVNAVICSALVPGQVAPHLLNWETISKMQAGSVVIDVAIDQGGNFAYTQPGEWITVNHVAVCGTKNIPGSIQRDASWLYANNVYHFVEHITGNGLHAVELTDEIARSSVVTHKGEILHSGTIKAMASVNAHCDRQEDGAHIQKEYPKDAA